MSLVWGWGGEGVESEQHTHSSEYKAYAGGQGKVVFRALYQSHSLPLLLPAALLLLVENLLELQEELVLLLLQALQLLPHLHHLLDKRRERKAVRREDFDGRKKHGFCSLWSQRRGTEPSSTD